MKELLEQVKSMMRPVNPENVQWLIDKLGKAPSIATLKEVLKHYEKELLDIRKGDILEWMQENEIDKFENEELSVSIRTHVSPKMADPDRGFLWLTERGYGDLIKDTLDFSKGELTPEIVQLLDEKGLSYSRKSGVHPQSLKKIVSDRLEAGEDLPEECDGINVGYFDEGVIKLK